MADAVIGIRIDPTGAVTGARTVRRSMDDITGSSRAATSAVNMLRAAMVSLGTVLSIRQLTDWADAWSTIQWRLGNATSSLQETERAMRRITQVARATWSSIDQTAEAFLRQEASMRALGYTTEQQIDHVEALNSALLISGLRGQRAQQVADAWARAMARGTLRGEEFNSVTMNASRLTQALADHLGVSVVELRKLAEEGKITSAAMFGITDSLTELRKEMEGDATLKGALVVLGNALMEVVGRADSAMKATSSLGNMIVWAADNIDFFAAVAGGVAVTAVVALTASINSATIATRAWAAALALTPLGAAAIAIGAVTTALIYYKDETFEVGDTTIRIGNVLHAVWTTVSQPVAALVRWIGSLLSALGHLATFDFSASWESLREGGQAWVDAGNNIIDAWRNLTAEGEQAETVSDAVAKALGNAGSVAGDAAKKFADVAAALSQQNERAMLMARAMGEGGAAVNRLNLEFEVYDNLLRAGVIPKTASLREALSLSTSMANDNARAIGDLTHTYWHYQQQIESLQRIQDLDDQLELAQAELRLVGETADVRAEALAVLEAEIRLKRLGVDLSSRLAQEELKRVRALARTREAISQNTSQMEEQRRLGKQVADDTIRYTSDLFADLFRETSDGWRGMWQNMRDTMISMLARMAAEAALRPIVVSVLGAMGVAGAGAAAGAAGVGGGGILGSLFGMGQQAASLGGAGGLFAEGGALAGVGSFMSQPLFMVPTGAIEAGTGAMAMAPGISLGGVLGAAGLGFMGGSMLAQLTGGNQMMGGLGGAGGAALGAAIGSAIPGIGTVIGGIAGGLLGGGLGSLFGGGSKKQEIRPISYAPSSGRGRQTPLRGIELDTLRYKGGGAFKDAVQQADEAIAQYLSDRMIEQVRDFLDERGTIRGKKRDNKAIGEKHIGRALREMYYPVIQALGGPEASRAFSSMTSGAKPEQVLETAVEVAAFLGQLHDETLFKPQEISQLEQAWKALNARIDDAKKMAEQLGQSLAEVERQGQAAREAFVDDFNESIQRAISDLTGGTVAMEQAFRDLQKQQKQRLADAELIGADIVEVERLNLLERLALLEQFGLAAGDFATETERSTFGIARYGQGIAQFAVNLGQASQRAAGQYRGLVDTLRTAAQDMLLGDQSVLSTAEQLELAREMFADLVMAASRGDAEAAAQLPQLGQRLLTLSRDFNASTEAYVQDFHSVREALLEVSDASAQFADEQQAIADHAAQMAQAYTEAMQAVAQAISDGVILPDEVAEIENRFGAVTDAARLMGPAGVLFAEELANVAKMLEDGLLTDNEIAVLMDNVALFNATLVDGLLTGGEISAIRIRQDLINDVIRKGTISDEALEALQAQARAVAAAIQHAVTDEALGSLRDHARTVADILQHDTIPRAVIDHLVTQADLIAGTIRGGVFDQETRKVLADRLADLRVLWRDGAPKPNDIKAIQAQVDLARAALVDGVVRAKELNAIKQQIALVRDAYADGVITNSEIQEIRNSTTRYVNELARTPNAIDKVTASIASAIARLAALADQEERKRAEKVRNQQIDKYASGVQGSVKAALGAGVAAGTRTEKTFTSIPHYRDGQQVGTYRIPTTRQVRDDSNRKAPLENALAQIAGHFQDMLGLGTLPKRTLKVDDGSPWFEQLTISGYGTITTSKINDMGRLASFMMESYADWATKGNRISKKAREIISNRNWNPGNVHNALANIARDLAKADLIPGFASGGYHAGGLAIVGERGPELVDFATPSRIYSAPDTSRIMAGFANDNGSFRELIAEVRELKAENVELRRAMIEGFGDTVQAEGISGEAQRRELRELREEVSDLRAEIKRQRAS